MRLPAHHLRRRFDDDVAVELVVQDDEGFLAVAVFEMGLARHELRAAALGGGDVDDALLAGAARWPSRASRILVGALRAEEVGHRFRCFR